MKDEKTERKTALAVIPKHPFSGIADVGLPFVRIAWKRTSGVFPVTVSLGNVQNAAIPMDWEISSNPDDPFYFFFSGGVPIAFSVGSTDISFLTVLFTLL